MNQGGKGLSKMLKNYKDWKKKNDHSSRITEGA